MKTTIKARITCLFFSKTTIMVNKRETIYFIISIFDKRLSSFFISLILSFSFTYISSFFPYLFRFNLSNLTGTCTFFFADIWAELSLLFLTFLSGTFFRGWWGMVNVRFAVLTEEVLCCDRVCIRYFKNTLQLFSLNNLGEQRLLQYSALCFVCL